MDDAWPEHLLAANHPVRQWNARSDTTWEAIRQDYLAGIPARDLCDRYEVALSTLRLKAREGGWRRADQPDSDLFPADADPWVTNHAGDDATEALIVADEEDWADLAARARFRLRRAIASGRAAEAASWMRVHDRLSALAVAEATQTDPLPDPLHPSLPKPEPEPDPDPLDAAMALAAKIGSLARSAAHATTEAEFEAIDAEVEVLRVRAAALKLRSGGPENGTTLDSLDSLDPVFSGPDEEPGAEAGLSP